jgi:hypothetical protein
LASIRLSDLIGPRTRFYQMITGFDGDPLARTNATAAAF